MVRTSVSARRSGVEIWTESSASRTDCITGWVRNIQPLLQPFDTALIVIMFSSMGQRMGRGLCGAREYLAISLNPSSLLISTNSVAHEWNEGEIRRKMRVHISDFA